MVNKLPDRWTATDLPVLIAAAKLLEDGAPVLWDSLITDATGFEKDAVLKALSNLDGAYLNGRPNRGDGRLQSFVVTDLTERGRRVVGLWPSGENVDALVDALRQAEDATDDPEEKSALRRAAGAVMGVSRDIMVDVVAAVVARQSGLG